MRSLEEMCENYRAEIDALERDLLQSDFNNHDTKEKIRETISALKMT